MALQFNEAALDELFSSPAGPVAKALKRRGIRVHRRAVQSLHQAGSGRQYGKHRASAPGDPPATDTGRLAASIREALHKDAQGLVEIIGTNVEYAAHLERGTRNIAPRPYLRPALAAERGQ